MRNICPTQSQNLKIAPLLRFACVVMISVLAGKARLAMAQFYQVTNLVSDVGGVGHFVDTNLHGAWGVARSGTSPWWVNSTFGGVSLLFNGAGQPQPLVVTIPPTNGAIATGIVFHGTPGFEAEPGKPSVFIFVTLNGTISGWNPTQTNRTLAILKVNNSGHAQYSGATIAQLNGVEHLYVANFGQGRIDVFDSHFQPVTLVDGAFTDGAISSSFSVFNVQLINHALIVTFAPKDVFGNGGAPGLGFVDVFLPDGRLVQRLKHGFWMNAPWGVALAPNNFGKLSDRLLIGMFGSGQIATFDTDHGNFHGLMQASEDVPITFGTGLWGLGFGNGATAGPTNTLFFARDFVANGFHGVFGAINPAPNTDDEMEPQEGTDAQ